MVGNAIERDAVVGGFHILKLQQREARGQRVVGQDEKPAAGDVFVMHARGDFLADIAAFGEADGVEKVVSRIERGDGIGEEIAAEFGDSKKK